MSNKRTFFIAVGFLAFFGMLLAVWSNASGAAARVSAKDLKINGPVSGDCNDAASEDVFIVFGATCVGGNIPDPETPTPIEPTEPPVITDEPTPEPTPTPTEEPTAEPTPTPPAVAGIHKCSSYDTTTNTGLGSAQFQKVIDIPPSQGAYTGLSILEGLVWQNNRLYFSWINWGAGQEKDVFSWSPSGGRTKVLSGAHINGMSIGPNGLIYAAQERAGRIISFDPNNAANSITPKASNFGGSKFNSPNDVVVSEKGIIYFTDPNFVENNQPSVAAYIVKPDGSIKKIPGGPPDKPNGIMLSIDEKTLFVGGRNGLWRYELNNNGDIASGPAKIKSVDMDGFTKDCAGNLYVTSGNSVLMLDRDGNQLASATINGGHSQLTNLAFGGADGKDLYVSTLGQGNSPGIYKARLQVEGFPN